MNESEPPHLGQVKEVIENYCLAEPECLALIDTELLCCILVAYRLEVGIQKPQKFRVIHA